LIDKPQREMKNKKIKLQLNKETIANLNNEAMSKLVGGNDLFYAYYPEAIQIATGDEAIANGLTVEHVIAEQGIAAGEEVMFLSIGSCHRTVRNCCRESFCNCPF
jgi:natural product precursor